MPAAVLPLHDGLSRARRFAAFESHPDHVHPAEWLFLIGMGACAAVGVAVLDFNLRLPGHAILRAVFPMACGLALAPRRRAGLVMGAGAVATAGMFRATGAFAPGAGALTSLCLIGPLLDLAVWRARPGWRLYAAFAAAGLAANVAAFAVRGGSKAAGLGIGGNRSLGEWLSIAPLSYMACGIVAGLVSAAVWFRWRADRPNRARPEDAP